VSTFFLVVIGWIIFRSESIGQAWEYISGMLQFETLKASYLFFIQPDLWKKSLAVLFMIAVEWVYRKDDHGFTLNNIRWPIVRIGLYYCMIATIIMRFGGF